MKGKKIAIWSLIVVILIAIGVYIYRQQVGADSNNSVETKLTVVDEQSQAVKRDVPLLLNFKTKVKVCYKRAGVVINCKWEDKTFSRLALTSSAGKLPVKANTYRDLTMSEAKTIVQNFVSAKIGRTLTLDEQKRLDKATISAKSINDPKTADTQIQKIVAESFKGYTFFSTNEDKIQQIIANRHAVNQIFTLGTAKNIPIAAGDAMGSDIALSSDPVLLALGGITNIAPENLAKINAINEKTAIPFFTKTLGQRDIAAAIKLAVDSTKTKEKWYTILSAEVRSVDTVLQGGPLVLDFASNYSKDASFEVTSSDVCLTSYDEAKDKFYDVLLALDKNMLIKKSAADDANFRNIIDSLTKYLESARLYGYDNAEIDKDVVSGLNKVIDAMKEKASVSAN